MLRSIYQIINRGGAVHIPAVGDTFIVKPVICELSGSAVLVFGHGGTPLDLCAQELMLTTQSVQKIIGKAFVKGC